MQKMFILCIALAIYAGAVFGQSSKSWTIMHYAAGGNSSEQDLLSDVAEMQEGKKSDEYNLVLLIDRMVGHSEDSTTLDGNFNDTRLYAVHPGRYERLSGKDHLRQLSTTSSEDLNLGDAQTLRNFVRYCKTYYPAEHYMLVVRSHGSGISMCPDVEEENADRLYPAELTDVLTSTESVDILGLDVCSMAGLENLYQWRPGTGGFSADFVIASAPLSGAWEYDHILERFDQDLSPGEFGEVVWEEILENQAWSSWALVDNRVIGDLKVQIDVAARSLAEENRTAIDACVKKSLGYHHSMADDEQTARLAAPYLDAFDFWSRIGSHDEFSELCRTAANTVCKLLDELVVRSYYGSGFLPQAPSFAPNKGGVYQIVPDGSTTYDATGRTFWSHSNWFHPDDRSTTPSAYGKYDWCKDGATPGNHQVDNFFELLDFLFDEENTAAGGVNGYQW